MTEEEFTQVESDLCASDEPFTEGLINVHTASEAVLATVPGIGDENASTLIAERQTRETATPTLAWVGEILDPQQARQAGPFLTSRTHQISADIAAVGQHGRGYRRVKFIFDSSEGEPRTVSRRDLSHMGWALGWQTRIQLEEAKRL